VMENKKPRKKVQEILCFHSRWRDEWSSLFIHSSFQ
jgi:hypothetical protein